MDKSLIYNALLEARAGLHEALGDLTDHFTIKHVKGYLETVNDAIQFLEVTGKDS